MNKCLNCNNSITKNKKFCNNSCSATHNNRLRIRTEESKNKTRLALLKFNKDNPNRRINYNTVLTEKSKKKISSSLKKYYKENPTKKHNQHDRIRLNRESVHRSRAKKLGLLPRSANIEGIKKFYIGTPDGYEVDHIKPFAIGGFHHQDNLQYLTAKENRDKGKKYSRVVQLVEHLPVKEEVVGAEPTSGAT